MLKTHEEQADFTWMMKDIKKLDTNNPTSSFPSIYTRLLNFTKRVKNDHDLWDHEVQQPLEEECLELAAMLFLQFLTNANFNNVSIQLEADRTAELTKKYILKAWKPFTYPGDVWEEGNEGECYV